MTLMRDLEVVFSLKYVKSDNIESLFMDMSPFAFEKLVVVISDGFMKKIFIGIDIRIYYVNNIRLDSRGFLPILGV